MRKNHGGHHHGGHHHGGHHHGGHHHGGHHHGGHHHGGHHHGRQHHDFGHQWEQLVIKEVMQKIQAAKVGDAINLDITIPEAVRMHHEHHHHHHGHHHHHHGHHHHHHGHHHLEQIMFQVKQALYKDGSCGKIMFAFEEDAGVEHMYISAIGCGSGDQAMASSADH